MSYDICWHHCRETIARLNSGKGKRKLVRPIQDNDVEYTKLNITFNLGPMFNWAYQHSWCEYLEGCTGDQVMTATTVALFKMIVDSEIAKTYESENGWGTYYDAVRFLLDLKESAEQNKNFFLEIDR